MSKIKKERNSAKGFDIEVYTEDFKNDYISLTDIAKYKNTDDPRFVIQNWMRNRNTLEFIGLWEVLNNPNFNRVQFDTFRNEAGLNRFTMTPNKWIESTDAIGIVSKAGRYGGTYAHYYIAMEFASWLSPEFKLYIIQDYKRLKEDENSKLSLTWNLHREISKINYKIHTDAIKEYLLKDLTNDQFSFKYASEEDMLNVALFNKRAKEWRKENPNFLFIPTASKDTEAYIEIINNLYERLGCKTYTLYLSNVKVNKEEVNQKIEKADIIY